MGSNEIAQQVCTSYMAKYFKKTVENHQFLMCSWYEKNKDWTQMILPSYSPQKTALLWTLEKQNILHVVRCPKLDTALKVRPHQY